MRATEFINEEAKASKYNGLVMKYAFNDNALLLKAFTKDGPLAFVKFVKEKKELYPENLWVHDDYRNRGIAKSMYDFLKSEGYIINRSHDQTKAGTGFWDKHRGEDSYVWEDDTVDEAEEGTPNAKEISNTLQKAGYKQLGSGADSTVWSKDEGSVIKIIMPEEGEDITTAANTFYKFYEFCQKNKGVPNLPKFIEIGGKHHTTFEINGKEYLQIAMEKLYPIPNNSVQEALVWALSDFVLSHTPWNKVVSTINNTDYFKNYETANVQQIEQAVKQTLSNKQENDKYHYLYELMRLVYATGRINKVGWDLHTENVMMRKNGELVIIDPWFAMNEGS